MADWVVLVLADEYIAFRSGFVFPDGTRHDDAGRALRQRLGQATIFVLDADAVAMACSVSLSKPSSILSAIPFVKLPMPLTWIEWSATDARAAMAELGSPNEKRNTEIRTFIKKVGFLLREIPDHPDKIQVEYVSKEVYREKEVIDASNIMGVFTLPKDLPDFVDPEQVRKSFGLDSSIKGRMRSHMSRIASDPYEQACDELLRESLTITSHPEFALVRRALERLSGLPKVIESEMNQEATFRLHFTLVLLASLILLNTRNAVETETVPAPDKLNKQRIAKGKEPLLSHRMVKIKLSAGKTRRLSTGTPDEKRSARATMVVGHFKVRNGKLFWWNPHARSGFGSVTKTYFVQGGRKVDEQDAEREDNEPSG